MKLYNGWRLYAFEPFAERLAALKKEVERLRAKDPEGYRRHPTTALLASVYKAITEVVPADPDHSEFRVGHSLGPQYAHWRRVKPRPATALPVVLPLQQQPSADDRLRLAQ